MSGNSSEIQNLKNKIRELEVENARLRTIIENVEIPLTAADDGNSDASVSKYDSDQGSRIIKVPITHKLSQYFFAYFWGRMDVYSLRYQNKKTGKAGYYPQCHNIWIKGVCPKKDDVKAKCKDCPNRSWVNLEGSQIEAHLRGDKWDASDVLGVYPLFPDGTCRFLVFDFDNHSAGASASDDYANVDENWKGEVDALCEICDKNNIPHIVERSRSGRGAHLWIFFSSPVEAALARRFGFALLHKGAESVNLTSFRFYDRMLPAQDVLEENGLGNLIALPLQGQALKSGNSAFIDKNWNAYPSQWEALFSTKRMSKNELEDCINRWDSSQTSNENDSFKDLPADGTKPWERNGQFHSEDVSGTLHIVLSNRIFIEGSNLKARLKNQIRRLAAFSNPKFYKNNAIGLSNYANPRYIYLGEEDAEYICIPRGLLETLTEKVKEANVSYEISDKRSCGSKVNVEFTGALKENQKLAAEKMLEADCGILSAATAFGKTVVGTYIIAQRKVSTLILLESSALIEQWEKALDTFLNIDEALPKYKTKSGQVRTRKSKIGIIQGSKDTSGGIIDIAMAGSLCKNGEFHPRLKKYGLVIVDECHHAASDTMSSVLREITAKYVYGVTATPYRGDGMEKIGYMLLGPIRFTYSAKERAEEQGIEHLIIPRFTHAVSPYGREKLHVNDAYEIIRKNNGRDEMIAADICHCIEAGRTPIVLTRFVDHATALFERVKAYADRMFLLLGEQSKKQRDNVLAQMGAVSSDESMILIATGKLIGEGFDFPRLDTLIMADPVAWKGVVEQYAGRLNRDYEGKENVIIYDYVDSHIPVFDNMYAKRLKAYRRIGYKLFTGGISEKQDANAIFDFETYLPVYEQDLREAKKEIIISSPTFGSNKVRRFLENVRHGQESGVKISIVTWHPDAYKYGRDEHRIELMETLRNAGCHIELMEEDCQRYAIIDREVVWYGSMNLLSKDDAEDNIMRVESEKIAEELLEITFGSDHRTEEYQLPL